MLRQGRLSDDDDRADEDVDGVGLARTPDPPYFAVTFTTRRSGHDPARYAETAARMCELAATQEGYLGLESVHDEKTGLGITISYWASLESIRVWREQLEHAAARARGRATWYQAYELRVCRVDRAVSWRRDGTAE